MKSQFLGDLLNYSVTVHGSSREERASDVLRRTPCIYRSMSFQAEFCSHRTPQAFEAVGKKVADKNLSHISEMMGSFKGSLEEFARKYKKDIKQDPAFRQQFQVMCSSIG